MANEDDFNNNPSGNFRYLIVKPHNGGIRDLARFLMKKDKESGAKFLESSDDGVIEEELLGVTDDDDDDDGETLNNRWVIFVSILVRKIIAVFGKPMEWTGYLVEFILNFLSINGSFLGLLYNILHVKGNLTNFELPLDANEGYNYVALEKNCCYISLPTVCDSLMNADQMIGKTVLPQRGSETFISAIGHLDGRIDLYKSETLPRAVGEPEALERAFQVEIGRRNLMDLCIMASKLAYENELVVRNVVNLHWKMHFVDFYNCWNDFQKENSTQVFILCDKPKDANLILVSFRGTEPFDADDWSTDFDYSWYEIPKLGKVHMGFLEALGLGNRVKASTFQENLVLANKNSTNLNGVDVKKSASKVSELSLSFGDSDTQDGSEQPSDSDQRAKIIKEKLVPLMGEKTAYYAVRSKLKNLLQEHKNAKFVVTGHSLGGALAILFPVVLVLHEEEVLQRMLAVYTFGQPRVGNRQLGRFMEAHVDHPVPKYFRVVYCNDLVPRLPYDDKTFLYKHFGACLYYNSLYIEQKVDEEPNRNYFGIRFLIPEYLNAVWELIRSFLVGYTYGPEYKEGWESTLLRVVGLVMPGISAHSPLDYVNSIRLGRERSIPLSSL